MIKKSPASTAARSFSPRDLVYPPMGAALLAISAWISIPAAIPFTMQTFGVFCILAWMGGKRGLLAIGLYLALGAIGLPVFSSFGGGVSALFGPTGGYLLGFVFVGLCYLIAVKLFGSKIWVKALSLGIGMAVCYVFGTAWYMILLSSKEESITLTVALARCVLPFLVPDLVKLALALAVSRRLPTLG